MASRGDVLPLGWKKGKQLGEGGFGTVYRCQDRLGRDLAYAAKCITISGDRMLREVAKEITLLQRLSHQYLIHYHGSSVLEPNNVYVIMEYASGGSIKALVKKEGRLPEARVRKYTRQILEGLVYLHNENVIHLDIKPANILLDDKDNIRLCDLGISKMLNPSGTLSGQVKDPDGTYIYMSPEILREEGYGRRTDIWSLGCTVVEMLSGQPPWYGLKTFELIHKISSKEHPKYTLPFATSAKAKSFLKQCFQRDKNKRPHAAELLKHRFCKLKNEQRGRRCVIL